MAACQNAQSNFASKQHSEQAIFSIFEILLNIYLEKCKIEKI